ncbi:MAG: chromate efflux transporter [Sporomusaceae bacterium]|nr:chromate efflux transporter [Sporomusaceae bacterium]
MQTTTSGELDVSTRKISLWNLFLIYFKIGFVGFGPTLAAETKKYLVKKTKWISEEEFINGLALAQLLPGATFASLTVYIGYRLRGISGAVTSFFALILPPFIIMVLLSHIYFTYGLITQVSILFKGITVVVVGLMAHAFIEIGKSVVSDIRGVFIALVGIVVNLYYSNIFMVLFLAAAAGIILYYYPLKRQTELLSKTEGNTQRHRGVAPVKQMILLSVVFLVIGYAASFQPILLKLGLVFFRMGALLFGGGFSMIPFIQQEVVMNYNWLTPDEFVVGIALGQVTPGPILITATFIGYKVASVLGAAAATLGIFLPSLFLVPATIEIHEKIKKNLWVQAALKGIVSTLAGMILVVIIHLARYSLVDLPSAVLAIGTFGVLRVSKLDTIWVIIGGTIIYWLMKW